MKERIINTPYMPLVALDKDVAVAAVPTPLRVETEEILRTVVSRLPDRDSKSIQTIPLTRLRIHPFNSRSVRTQKRIDEVRDMLEAEHTQREAITVVPGRREEDRDYYYILSGQTRFHAAVLAGWEDLDAQFNLDVDPDNHLEFWSASIEHNTSIPETDWDLAIKAKALADEGVENDKIRKAIRRDERGLRRLLAITDLPEKVLSLVKEHPEKLTAVFCEVLKAGLADLGPDEIVGFAKNAVDNDLSRRELDDQIKRATKRKAVAAAGQQRATRDLRTPVMVGGEKAGEFKVMKSRNDGQRLISLTANLPEALVDAFKLDIQLVLEKLAEIRK